MSQSGSDYIKEQKDSLQRELKMMECIEIMYQSIQLKEDQTIDEEKLQFAIDDFNEIIDSINDDNSDLDDSERQKYQQLQDEIKDFVNLIIAEKNKRERINKFNSLKKELLESKTDPEFESNLETLFEFGEKLFSETNDNENLQKLRNSITLLKDEYEKEKLKRKNGDADALKVFEKYYGRKDYLEEVC